MSIEKETFVVELAINGRLVIKEPADQKVGKKKGFVFPEVRSRMREILQ
jgi:hypothetical protein